MLVNNLINSSIMKKQLYLTFMLTLGCCTVSAQDIILKKNADEIQAKVLKIDSVQIEYKKWDNPDGPIYTLAVSEIVSIKYQNGTEDILSTSQTTRRPFRKTDAGNFPKYRGEINVGFGFGIGDDNKIGIETIHGVRFNPSFFTGLGIGCYDYYDFSDPILPVFVDIKGYYPILHNISIYLALDAGAAIDVNYDSTEAYLSTGPGINFGKSTGRLCGDFGIRYQHLGEGMNALLFRVGVIF